jgi:hypothetical protein
MNENRVLKQETLLSGKFVSTVWLGVVGNRSKNFETMIFSADINGKVAPNSLDCLHAQTEKEALENHCLMVMKWNMQDMAL